MKHNIQSQLGKIDLIYCYTGRPLQKYGSVGMIMNFFKKSKSQNFCRFEALDFPHFTDWQLSMNIYLQKIYKVHPPTSQIQCYCQSGL